MHRIPANTVNPADAVVVLDAIKPLGPQSVLARALLDMLHHLNGNCDVVIHYDMPAG